MARAIERIILTSVLVAGIATSASAGGWDKNEQSVDLLFDPGKLVFDVNGTYQMINRVYQNYINVGFPGGPLVTDKPFDVAPDQWRGSVNLKFDLFDNSSCLASLRTPFALKADYPNYPNGWLPGRVSGKDGSVRELGLTCSYRWKMGPGYARAIGGVVNDSANFTFQSNNDLATIKLNDSSSFGWRAGVGYEIPEYAMRATLMYYSAVGIGARGEFTTPVPPPTAITGGLTLPQAVELAGQTGVAPGWLVMGSVKWVDWSVIQAIPIKVSANNATLTTLNTFFGDGWTISAGVGHQFDKNWSGTARIAWDKGLGGGQQEYSDTWTLALGGKYTTDDKRAEFYGGLSFAALSPGDLNTATYTAHMGWDTAVSAQLGVRIRLQ